MCLGYRGEDYSAIFSVRMLIHATICRHDASYGPSDTPQEMITRLKYLRPAFELREQWSYNNIVRPCSVARARASN